MAGRPTRPEQHLIAQRRQDAITLRLAGLDYLTIGKKLAADPAVNSQRTAYPAGYGIEAYQAGNPPPTEKALAEIVKQDLHRVLRQRRTKIAEGLDQLRDLQDERLNRLLTAAWSNAIQGDSTAIQTVLRIMERQSKLHGLDAPVRTEVTGADGGAVKVQAVTEEERQAAILSVLSFRADRAQAGDAVAALEEAVQ
jgi:hypothetical protein